MISALKPFWTSMCWFQKWGHFRDVVRLCGWHPLPPKKRSQRVRLFVYLILLMSPCNNNNMVLSLVFTELTWDCEPSNKYAVSGIFYALQRRIDLKIWGSEWYWKIIHLKFITFHHDENGYIRKELLACMCVCVAIGTCTHSDVCNVCWHVVWYMCVCKIWTPTYLYEQNGNLVLYNIRHLSNISMT